MKRRIILPGIVWISLLWLFSGYEGSGQENHAPEREEILLAGLFEKLPVAGTLRERMAINREILDRLGRLLILRSSAGYPFGLLKNAGIISSPDSAFRMFQWFIPGQGGSFSYECLLQVNHGMDSLCKVVRLSDVSALLTAPGDTILDNGNWFGCLYYEIIPVMNRGKKMYTLLGIDRSRLLTNIRVIDILHFDGSFNPVFGSPVFYLGREPCSRVVFRYSKQAGMLLRYDPGENRIVFDHLSPPRPDLEGRYEYYGPDFSYDGLKYKDNQWVLVKDIDLRNR